MLIGFITTNNQYLSNHSTTLSFLPSLETQYLNQLIDKSLPVSDERRLLLSRGQLEGHRQRQGPRLQLAVEPQSHAVHAVHYQHEERFWPAKDQIYFVSYCDWLSLSSMKDFLKLKI